MLLLGSTSYRTGQEEELPTRAYLPCSTYLLPQTDRTEQEKGSPCLPQLLGKMEGSHFLLPTPFFPDHPMKDRTCPYRHFDILQFGFPTSMLNKHR